jgi:hypothetical protein
MTEQPTRVEQNGESRQEFDAAPEAGVAAGAPHPDGEGGQVALADAEASLTGKLQTAIVAYMRTQPGVTLFTKVIADAIRNTPGVVRTTLHRLREKGIIRQEGNGWVYTDRGGGAPAAVSERDILAGLDAKFEVIRDRVRAVCEQYATGLYLYGTGGLGKSYTVLKTLEELGYEHHQFHQRITAKGLFDALRDYPNSVLLLEDVDRLAKDCDAQGVLRAALWGQPGEPRLVTWTTARGRAQINYEGAVIMIANTPIRSLPELRALATRIIVH